jgi:hypothetical protein
MWSLHQLWLRWKYWRATIRNGHKFHGSVWRWLLNWEIPINYKLLKSDPDYERRLMAFKHEQPPPS